MVVLWELYTRLYAVPEFLLPLPLAVWNALIEAAKGQLLGHLLYTIGILTLGFAIGVVLGVAGGLALAKSRRLERWFGGPLLFLG